MGKETEKEERNLGLRGYGRWQKKGKKRELWGRHREGEGTVGRALWRSLTVCLYILLLG